jgi:hypothetical protein
MNPEVSRRLARALSLLPPFYESDYQRLINEAAFVESFQTLSSYAKNYILKAETKLADRGKDNLEKHRSGQHDQASHGRKGGFGVPDYVDIEGKRFSKEAAAEFTRRLVAYEEGLNDKFDELLVERYGKPWSELTNTEREDARSRTRLTEDGRDYVRNPDGSVKEFPNVRDEANNDPKVAELGKAVQDHYLMKDAMGQKAWNEDGTLGPKTVGETLIRGEVPSE